MSKEEIEQIRQRILEERERMKDPEYRRQKQIEYLLSMKPFDPDDNGHINEPPRMSKEDYAQYVIPNYIRCGAIPKKDLIDGETYYGSCRNASYAIWHADKEAFTYQRHKWGSTYDEDINHFEDDDGYDVFVPVKRVEDPSKVTD